jgi:transposase
VDVLAADAVGDSGTDARFETGNRFGHAGEGGWERTRLSKAGNARLRRALYLPALTAIRFNPLLKAFFERLVAAGKSRMAAVGACMRKLIMICYGVLKDRTPCDPSWGKSR